MRMRLLVVFGSAAMAIAVLTLTAFLVYGSYTDCPNTAGVYVRCSN